MKVLVFTTLYPNNMQPHHGVFVKERMTRVAQLDGCRVKVVAPVPYFPPVKLNWRWRFSQVARTETIEGVDVYHPRYAMTPKLAMASYGFMMFLSVFNAIRGLRRQFDFDLIDSHYVYPDGFAAMLLGRVLRKPVVVSARGSDINLFGQFRSIRPLIQWTLHRANAVVAVCQALKDAMVKLGAPDEKIVVLPNGVDAEKFRPVPKVQARQTLGLPDKGRIVLAVGELIQRKGIHLLIPALRTLREHPEYSDLQLIVVGEGRLRPELESLIASRNLQKVVRLVGAVPHRQLYLWYSAADVFCLASDREGWPNVVLESLACGTPVVATRVWGVPEIIRSERLGILTSRTEEALADAISRALTSSWDVGGLVAFARQQTWERVALSVRDVFDAVVKREAHSSNAVVRDLTDP